MSSKVKSVLVEESAITLTLTIPVDFDADHPLAHLANEGSIQEGVRQAGLRATETLYQKVADRHNAIRVYHNQEGYTLRQDDQSTQAFLTPYGHMNLLRPHFYNDYTHASATPFEHETRMDQHRITPMMQYIILRELAKMGPAACAKDLAEEIHVGVSHHMIDEFLEDMGKRHQTIKPELTQTVLEEGWKPAWLQPEAHADRSVSEPRSRQESARSADDPIAEEGPSSPLKAEVGQIPVVQMDAMSVTERRYHETIKDGKQHRCKYHTERHHMDNAVVGFLNVEGPRQAGDEIDLQGKRFFSRYRGRDEVTHTAAQYLQACGIRPGDLLLCHADGDDLLWESFAAAFPEYRRVEVLDERHTRKNLKCMARLIYGKAEYHVLRWVEKRMSDLYEDRYESFYNGLNYLVRIAPDDEAKKQLQTKRSYFRRHGKRIRYGEFLRMGYPLSTCFVESAHRHVIGDRLRHNGRSYREDRLQMIADLRCEFKSERLPYVFERLLEPAA